MSVSQVIKLARVNRKAHPRFVLIRLPCEHGIFVHHFVDFVTYFRNNLFVICIAQNFVNEFYYFDRVVMAAVPKRRPEVRNGLRVS